MATVEAVREAQQFIGGWRKQRLFCFLSRSKNIAAGVVAIVGEAIGGELGTEQFHSVRSCDRGCCPESVGAFRGGMLARVPTLMKTRRP